MGSGVILLNLLCAMLATGIPTRDGLILAMYCAVVTTGGAGIYSWVIGRRPLTLAETLGAGFAIGTALPALFSFLIGEFGYRSTTITWLWLAILGAASIASILRMPERIEVGPGSFVSISVIPLIAVFGYHAWSPLLWPYLFGFIIILAARFVLRFVMQSSSYAKLDFDLTTLLLAPIVGLSLQILAQHLFEFRRPYLYLGWLTDNIFDEGLTWSVARYGYSDNPFFQGHRVIGYLLTNAWAGDIYESLGVSPFTVVSSFGILASLMAVLFITISICERHGLSRRIATIAVVLVGLQGSFGELFPLTEPPRVQHALSMAWLFLSILVVEEFIDHPRSLTTILIFLMALAVLLGKTQMFIVLIGFFLISALVGSIKHRQITHIVLAVVSTGLLVFAFQIASDRYFSARTNPWILYSDTDTYLLWVLPILITLMTRTFIPFTLLGRIGTVGNWFALRVAMIGFPVVMAYSLYHDTNALRHVVEAVLLLGSLSAAPLVDKTFQSESKILAAIALVIGLIFGALVYIQGERTIILNLAEDSWTRLLAFEHPTYSQIGFILISSVVLVPVALDLRLLSKRQRDITFRWAILSVVGLAALGANVGTLISWSSRFEVRGLIALEKGESWPDRGQQFEPHLFSLDWVRSSTKRDVVVANNLLCKGLPVNGLAPGGSNSTDCALRNMSALVTAFGQRRSYIDGPWQAFITDKSLGVANQRYRDSILFATNNDPNSFSRLIRDGVEYFVVDLGQTSLRDWEPRGTIRYKDDHYAVLELNN